MRISRVHINSFAGTRGRTVKLSPGLNVIYGENESGKTTLKSFITGTMFPDRLPTYPASKTSDSGEVEVVLEDGSTEIIRREGRKSNSPGPELCGISGNEYRSIYSLDPEGLRDMGGVDSVRSRLLTVPGASAVPSAEEAISKERTSLMPDSRRSANCTVSRLKTASAEADRKVFDMNAAENGDNAYGDLVKEEAYLAKMLETAKGDENTALQSYAEAKERQGTERNIARLKELKAERDAYAGRALPDPDTSERYERLCADRRKAKEDAESAEENYQRVRSAYNGPEPSAVPSLEPRVTKLEGAVPAYMYARDGRNGNNGLNPIVIVGAVIAVAGVAAAALFNVIAGGIAIAAGAAVALIGLRRNGSTSAPDPIITRTENLWKELCTQFGIMPSDIRNDIQRMKSLMKSAESVSEEARKRDGARSLADSVDERIRSLTERFGGEEGYDEAVKAVQEIAKLDAAIETLEATIPAEPAAPVQENSEQAYMDVREKTESLSTQLASVRARMRTILSDTKTEEALTASSAARAEYMSAVRRWIALAAETYMLDTACDTLSDKNRPSVYSDADRFVCSMTGGKYGIVSDIRTRELMIEDRVTGERSNTKKWSSGTEDQVKLAMKLGLALSLSGDIPPMILDDVLLTSDDRRTDGCIKALKEFSESAQVLYFTCSRDTRDRLESAGAAVTEL